MPDPQPGWCQQYNYEMVPIWARKFEPPAITGWESQDVMETLIKIARYTGEKKYLEPIPRALAYFKKCLLPDGQGRPLLRVQDEQAALHGRAVPAHLRRLRRPEPLRLEAAGPLRRDREGVPGRPERRRPAPARPAKELEEDVRRIIRELDEEGRWITTYAGERLVGQPKFGAVVPLHLQRRLQPQRRDAERVRRVLAQVNRPAVPRRGLPSAGPNVSHLTDNFKTADQT